MVTVIDFLTQLGTSVVELFVIFFTEVAFNDPLAFVSFLTGGLLVAVSVAVMGYLALGAVGSMVGMVTSTPNRPPDARGRGGSGGEH